MNWNLYFKELKRNRSRFIIWTLLVVCFILFTISIVPSMLQDRAQLENFLQIYPEALKKAFGMDPETWSSPLGIYVTYHVFYSYLLGGIFSITFAVEIISKEESRRTAEFLLTRPVTRSEVVASKASAFFSYLLAFNLAEICAGLIGLVGFFGSDFDFKAVLSLGFFGFIFTALLGSLGLFLSLLIKRGRTLVGLGTGLVLIAYILDTFAKAAEKVSFLRWASPFKFADFSVLQGSYGFDWWRLLYFLGLSALFIFLTFAIYRRKDIYV